MATKPASHSANPAAPAADTTTTAADAGADQAERAEPGSSVPEPDTTTTGEWSLGQ